MGIIVSGGEKTQPPIKDDDSRVQCKGICQPAVVKGTGTFTPPPEKDEK